MKVLFTVDALINAGTERSMLDLVPHFSKEIELKVVYFYPRHDLKAEYEAAGISLHFAGLNGKFNKKEGVRKLTAIIRAEKPDLVISSLLRANLISRSACKKTGTPLIGTFVSDSYSEQRTGSFSWKRKLGAAYYYWLDRLSADIPVAWISNSESIKKSNARALHIDPDKVKVIYRGRDASQFNAWEKPGQPPFRIVTIGRLLQTKGFQDLLSAIELLKTVQPGLQLDIYGEGPFRNTLIRLIAEKNLTENVTLHGNVKNAWQKLYGAHCFVFPSWYEGFSGALIEAMMVGLPIVASDIPMNLEAVTDHETALVHRVKDPDHIFGQLMSIMKHYEDAVQLGNRAREEAIRRFDIKNIARSYENFLRETVKKNKPVK